MREGKYYSCINEFLVQTKDEKIDKFLFVAEYTNFDNTLLQQCQSKICGCIVPFVVYDTNFYNKGLIAYDLDGNDDFVIAKDMGNFQADKSFFSDTNSLIVILDGLSSNITDFLEVVFDNSSTNTQVIGCGAGKMTFEKDPVIFDNFNLYENAALVISTDNNLSIGIENGWEVLEGPFLATNTQKNILKKLNFKSAFEVYKEVVEKDCGMKFNDDNFFDIAKSYPLGIIKYDKELIIRDPIIVNDDGSMVLVGDITQNSTINILKGTKDNLIESSGRAVEKSCTKKYNKNPKSLILFDCISRSIFLGDRFEDELKIMKDKIQSNIKLTGALTLGEIANNGNEYITFYNKTCVVGVLC